MNLISKRAQRFQSSGIRKIFDMAATLKDPINFSIGQPDFGISNEVKKETIKAITSGHSKYTPTPGILPLRKKIAERFANNGIIKTTNDILVTSGTSAAFFLALSAILDEGDEVIIPDPYFVEYPELVKFLGGRPIYLDTYPNFQPDSQKLTELITSKTKVVILNSPNNPTGAVYPEKVLREIAQIAKKYNLVVISDEIYEEFVYDVKHFSIGSIYENTITINGLSKSGGMPGWRLAWATGPQEVIQKMIEIQQYTIVCAPSLVQYGALAAFNQDFSNIKRGYQKRRDLIYELLSKKFDVIKPQGAFYIMPKVENVEEFVNQAMKNNVLLIPSGVFSQKNTHIRISYSVSEEQIKKGSEILLKLSRK